MLCGVIVSGALGIRAVEANTTEEARVERVRASILKKDATKRVEIKLMNDTKLRGYVSNVGADAFTFRDHETGATTTVAFADVKKVSSPSLLSTQTKAIIGISAAAAGVIVLFVARGAFCDGQC